MRRTRGSRGDRRLTSAGVALLVLAALLAASASGAFGAATADRGLSVAVADDPDSYLGVHDETESTESELTFGQGSPIVIYALADNAGAYDTSTADQVSAELVAFGGDADPDLTVEVVTGGDADWLVELGCGDETRDLDAATATVELSAVGDVTVLAERTTARQVTPNCAS